MIRDLFAHGRQLKHLVFDDRIVNLLGKLPILGCFIPEIVSPFHIVDPHPMSWIVTTNACQRRSVSGPKHDNIRPAQHYSDNFVLRWALRILHHLSARRAVAFWSTISLVAGMIVTSVGVVGWRV
jgi:hypothetical protein